MINIIEDWLVKNGDPKIDKQVEKELEELNIKIMEGKFYQSTKDIEQFLKDKEYSQIDVEFYLATKNRITVDIDIYEEMKSRLHEEVGDAGWDSKWDL